MRRYFLLSLVILLVIAMAGCGDKEGHSKTKTESADLTISAAASLTDAVQELKDIYISEHPEVNLTINFASSGTLQHQIEQGAPADVFISASKSKMDSLAEKSLIIKNTRKDILNNEIVMITQNDNNNLSGFKDLSSSNIDKVSIGTPESVPAGRYAKETLISLELWNELQTTSKLVLAKDVRQVLAYVETGNVDAGVVYSSDTIIGKNIKTVATAPASSHKPIVYPTAVIKNTEYPDEAKAFIKFISGKEAAQIFTKYGFKPLNK